MGAPGTLMFIVILLFTVNDIFCFPRPKIVYPSITNLRSQYPESASLLMVGTYIAAHKYFGVDWRYQSRRIVYDDRTFYKEFPTPPLKPEEFHPLAKASCEKGAESCVKDVGMKAQYSGSMKHIFRGIGRLYMPAARLYGPFKSYYEMFQYRQTAMYYLCWYTKRRNKVLRFPNDGVSCLSQLWATRDLLLSTRKRLYESGSPAIVDIREKTMKGDPYLCAELWFCPDPCYGRETYGNYKKPDNPKDKHPGNPCNDLDDSTCTVKAEDNKNFDGLMKNMFNISCACENKRKGFAWDSRFQLCVDLDECERNVSHCPRGKMCRNTVGSYICTCPKGYKENSRSKRCDRVMVLESRAKDMAAMTSGNEDEDSGDIFTDLMEFAGLSRACTSTLSISLACAVMLAINF